MKTGASLKRHSLPVLVLLLALLPALCSCVSMAQRGAVDLAYRAYNKGDYPLALRRLSRAESYHSEMSDRQHAEVLLLKGRCVEGIGNRAEAASLYEYLVKTYPDTEFAARAKGRLEELRQAGASAAPSPGPTSHRDP
jgi:outer membrane protein assembly factor BamD (BamD/ComL family)